MSADGDNVSKKLFRSINFLNLDGIDPAQFSSNLMKNCRDIVTSGEFEPQRPDLIIANAFDKLCISPRPIG